jgi:hypothetical protein
MSDNIITEAIDKTEIMTLKFVVNLLKKHEVGIVIGELETLITNAEKRIENYETTSNLPN